MGKIIERPTLESFHNVTIMVGWYHVWVTKASHPYTIVQWPDELECKSTCLKDLLEELGNLSSLTQFKKV